MIMIFWCNVCGGRGGGAVCTILHSSTLLAYVQFCSLVHTMKKCLLSKRASMLCSA
jgi:hypothetical protein